MCMHYLVFLTHNFKGKDKPRKARKRNRKTVILAAGRDSRHAGVMSRRSREKSFSEDEEEVEEETVP